MLLTSQNRGNKNIRFMSLGKRKIGTFSAAVWRQPSCFSCLSICLPAALNSHRLYAFLFFLSICFPVCQSLCLSLFSHVYLFLTSLFLSVKSIWISLPALSEMHPHRAVFFFFCLFPKGILNLFQTCPHEYRPARHLFTGHGGIEFQDLHFAVWARARRRVVGFLCLPNRACQSTPGDKDIGGAPAELWKSSIYVHRLIAQPRTSTCLRLHVKNIVCVCACVCVCECVTEERKERRHRKRSACAEYVWRMPVIKVEKGQRAPKSSFFMCVCVCVRVCVSLYLVGSTGGVESICSTNKQGVIILLQEDFDEIVTLVLQGAGRERRKKVRDDISVF